MHFGLTFPDAAVPPFWGVQGHRVVARAAMERLTPGTAAAVQALLGRESMVDVSVWADEIRESRPATGPWHYVNIPVIESRYLPATHCPRRRCLIAALDSLLGVLADRSRPRAARAEALRFVIHLVADLHQPLHVGDRGDRGGNDVTIRFAGRQTRLHAFWDSGLLDAAGWSDAALGDTLRARIDRRRDLPALGRGTIAEWAMETHDVARDQIYRTLPGTLAVTQADAVRLLPVAHEQLLRAAVRLAAVLERTLKPKSP